MIVVATQDGTWMARCPRTGTHATGSTRDDAAAELRRKIGERGA
jgi:hypothetical protein